MSSPSDAAAATAAAPTSPDLDLDGELQQLLKEQEEFLQQSKRPAAKVSRVGGGNAPAAHSQPTASTQQQQQEPALDGPQVLGSVVERDVIELNIRNVNVMPRAQAGGFPAVQRRGESLFGKRQRQAGLPPATVKPTAKPSRFSAMKKAEAAEREAAAQPLDAERQEIDRSNRARLQEMSVDEIRQAQQELMASLDPELIEKLMRKKTPKHKATKKASDASSALGGDTRRLGAGTGVGIVAGKTIVKDDEAPRQQTPPAAPIDLAKIQSEDELREQARLLPPEERAKHEWMQSPSTGSAAAGSASAKSAGDNKTKTRKEKLQATTERFDFNGERISSSDMEDQPSIPAHSGLFHHGDEPDAAGYTMGELIHLARSTVASQRAMALTTIAKILRKREGLVKRGDLAKVFPRVLPNDLPITMRIALDDQNYSALSAAISALHAFLVPSQDVGFSDAVSSWFEGRFGVVVSPPRIHLHQNIKENPSSSAVATKLEFETSQTEEVVYISTSESDDGTTISDEELTFLDPVQGFLNMDIGTRLRFILESIQLPDPSANDKMLDILLQIANHSPKAAKNLGSNAKLMKAIQRKFIESEEVLTLQEENEAALRLTVKALVLVRALCQGSRVVGAFLIGNGVIQSTKGFLAVQPSKGGNAALSSTSLALYYAIQTESLRIWRVLLKYGLDFHCFAYLFPVLCGFRGADLVRPAGEQPSESDKLVANEQHSLRQADGVTAALFAALEALCGLQTVHEAQHYFGQLDFFIHQAKDEVLAQFERREHADVGVDGDQGAVLAAALRFLAASAPLATKYHLDSSSIVQVLERLHANPATVWEAIAAFADVEVLSAVVYFHHQVLAHDLLGDDMDDDDVASAFFTNAKPHLLSAVSRGVQSLRGTTFEREAASARHVPQLCHLLTLTSDLIVRVQGRYGDGAFIASMYASGLSFMEAFVSGHEFWITELLTKLLFHPVVLQRVGFFPNEVDAVAISRVLVPIYQALVNTSNDKEEHSLRNFAVFNSSPTEKLSCQLRVPQYENEYVGSNLPLPGFWMFSPFSRTEFASSADSSTSNSRSSGGASDPSCAESDEMKLIVSATCRYLYQLETTTQGGSSSVSGAWRDVDVAYQREMRDEDKFFHLLHVFFAGAEVLFDPHVDTALHQFLRQFAVPVLKSKGSTTLLYDGLLRNLRRFQHLDPNFQSSEAAAGASFTSDEQIVMTFVEKLVAEFTSSSYGNVHFARCVTLLLASDFPIAIRKWVWRELYDCRLLQVLQSFAESDSETATFATTFARCTQSAVVHDEQLLQAMKQALSQRQITAGRGAFAFCVAVHHLTVYLFGRHDAAGSSMSFARQVLAQDLVRDAPAEVWRCLLSYDSSTAPDAAITSILSRSPELKPERVQRMTTHAGLTPDLLAAFSRVCDAAAAAASAGPET